MIRTLPALRLLATTAATLWLHAAQAQCPGCVPDTNCSVDPPFPALCPLQPPDATAGEYYETDITFWLPQEFEVPGQGITVQFDQMLVTSISGLPFGLAVETSDPQGVYYPQESQYGCARICGTPLGAGTFNVNINIIASVSFSGIPINAPEQFTIPLVVQPGSGGNAGFSFSPASGCNEVTTSFQALIDASPSPTTHAWDFGNGNTSTAALPPPQTYDTPGVHEISLQTTISAYVLQQVVLNGVNDNWCGDVEEPNIPLIGCTGSPDLYFVLTDANGGTVTSNTVGDVFSASWSELGLVLDNPPYNISFWDEDVISQNDHLGTFNIPQGSLGSVNFNVAGGTFGSLLITLEPQQTFTFTDSVVVFPGPDTTVGEEDNSLCATGADIVGYLWFHDGDTVPGATAACITPNAPGLWWVQLTNGFGCTALSAPVVICPDVAIAQNAGVLFTDAGYASYAWTYNGNPIPGGDGPFVFDQGEGTYTVTITTSYGCTVSAELVVTNVGIGTHAAGNARVAAFPNPSDGRLTLVAEDLAGAMAELRISDLSGRTIWQERQALHAGQLRMDLALDAAPGRYVLELLHGDGRAVLQLMLY